MNMGVLSLSLLAVMLSPSVMQAHQASSCIKRMTLSAYQKLKSVRKHPIRVVLKTAVTSHMPAFAADLIQ